MGLCKWNGQVYADIILNAQEETVMPIIRSVVRSGTDIYTDRWRSYDVLAVYGYDQNSTILRERICTGG
jgi:transposase-like protein